MGILHKLSTTSRPQPADVTQGSSAQAPSHAVTKLVLLRFAGSLIIVSLFAMAAAIQNPAGNRTASTSKQHTSSVDISKQAAQQPQSQTQTSPDSSASPAQPAAGTGSTGSTQSSGASNTSNSSIRVTVNGQQVPVPENGSTHQTITSPDGSSTSVNINTHRSANGSSYNSSFTTNNSGSIQTTINDSTTTSTEGSDP